MKVVAPHNNPRPTAPMAMPAFVAFCFGDSPSAVLDALASLCRLPVDVNVTSMDPPVVGDCGELAVNLGSKVESSLDLSVILLHSSERTELCRVADTELVSLCMAELLGA